MGLPSSSNYVRQVSLPQEAYTPEYFSNLYNPIIDQVGGTGPVGYARMGLLDVAPQMQNRQAEQDFLKQNLLFRMGSATVPSYFGTPPDVSGMSLLGPLAQPQGSTSNYQAQQITPDYLQRMAEEEAAREEEKRRQQQAAQQRRRLTPQQEYYYHVLDPQTEAERRIKPPGGQMKWTWEGGSKYIDDYGNVAVLSEGGR